MEHRLTTGRLRYIPIDIRGSLLFLLNAVILVLFVVFISWAVYQTLTAPREGTVEATWIEPAHFEQYQSGSICISYNASGGCDYSMPIYSQRWVDTRCWMRINDTEKTKRKWTWQINCNNIPEVGKWVGV